MKTELSHNKIALFKSKKPLRCISDHLIVCIIFSPYLLLPFSPLALSYFHLLRDHHLVRSLQAINSSATT